MFNAKSDGDKEMRETYHALSIVARVGVAICLAGMAACFITDLIVYKEYVYESYALSFWLGSLIFGATYITCEAELCRHEP